MFHSGFLFCSPSFVRISVSDEARAASVWEIRSTGSGQGSAQPAWPKFPVTNHLQCPVLPQPYPDCVFLVFLSWQRRNHCRFLHFFPPFIFFFCVVSCFFSGFSHLRKEWVFPNFPRDICSRKLPNREVVQGVEHKVHF